MPRVFRIRFNSMSVLLLYKCQMLFVYQTKGAISAKYDSKAHWHARKSTHAHIAHRAHSSKIFLLPHSSQLYVSLLAKLSLTSQQANQWQPGRTLHSRDEQTKVFSYYFDFLCCCHWFVLLFFEAVYIPTIIQTIFVQLACLFQTTYIIHHFYPIDDNHVNLNRLNWKG